jgi:threonine/homoserine/homoserine lactone efflux protein
MLMGLFLKGSLIGFSMAIPIGPVGIMCIQHSLHRGLLAGIMAGLGAALADALYGCMAGLGMSPFSHFFTDYQFWFQMIGALILCYVGVKIFRSHPQAIEYASLSFSCRQIFFSTFALTLTNPFTLICFATVYAGLGITPTHGALPAVTLTLGVLLGAIVWWLVLSFGVTCIGKKWHMHASPLPNQISGVILTGLGSLACLSAIHQWLF